MPPVRVSVTIITKNEAARLDAALASVAWADEIVVVDAGSTDATADIARRASARVFVEGWPGFPQQKNRAADLASHDWILSIDADEQVSPALADEIRALLGAGPTARGYRVPRVTRAFGRELRATDWYPDWQLRLYDRRAGRWDETRTVHESVRLDGDVPTLRGEILHEGYRDLSDHLQTIDRYTTLAAEANAARGRDTSLLGIALHPPLAFLRNYVLRRGFTAGTAGLVVSAMNSWYVFLKLAKLWER
ncbi:MAG: glycosyltransferase family 2 protein, partial [Vicinamibacteraceae bacterium]